jgi:hypothetical protein
MLQRLVIRSYVSRERSPATSAVVPNLRSTGSRTCEQLNLRHVSGRILKALPFLFERHPEAGGFCLNLCTKASTDIASLVSNVVAAEIFAAAHPSNNRKLTKDVQKLVRDYECPEAPFTFAIPHDEAFRALQGRLVPLLALRCL